MAQDVETLAHRIDYLENNFKTYLVGNTYNGVTISLTGIDSAVNSAIGWIRLHKDYFGTWFMKFQIYAVFASVLQYDRVTISGITAPLAAIIPVQQWFSMPSNGIGAITNSAGFYASNDASYPNIFRWSQTNGSSVGQIGCGFVMLGSKPSFAD